MGREVKDKEAQIIKLKKNESIAILEEDSKNNLESSSATSFECPDGKVRNFIVLIPGFKSFKEAKNWTKTRNWAKNDKDYNLAIVKIREKLITKRCEIIDLI